MALTQEKPPEWVWEVISRMREKYSKLGVDYDEVARYVIYLDPDIPLPYEEVYEDYIEWAKAIKTLRSFRGEVSKHWS